MTPVLFGTGIGLILFGLWNRDEERRALALFAAGAVFIVIASLRALADFDPPAG